MRTGCTLQSTLDITLKMHTIKHLLRRRPLLGSDVILPWGRALIQGGGAYLKNALPGGGGAYSRGRLFKGGRLFKEIRYPLSRNVRSNFSKYRAIPYISRTFFSIQPIWLENFTSSRQRYDENLSFLKIISFGPKKIFGPKSGFFPFFPDFGPKKLFSSQNQKSK